MTESHAHSADEYLMTIYLLAHPVGEYLPSRSGQQPTVAARIADQLHVSRASVGEMLKRLEADGMITRGEHKEALLTERGSETAERIVRRHRLVERLLTDVMGYSAPEAHEKADGLDDGFDDEMIERLFEKLGRPERCPHGYPIDPALEKAENPFLLPLDEAPAGARAEVIRLAEHDGDLLRFFYDEAGLEPGTQLVVTTTGPDGVRVERGEDGPFELAPAQAQGVFVRLA